MSHNQKKKDKKRDLTSAVLAIALVSSAFLMDSCNAPKKEIAKPAKIWLRK